MAGDTIEELQRKIGCCKLELPIIYLGVFLGGNPCSRSFWNRVENKVAKHLKSWNGGLHIRRQGHVDSGVFFHCPTILLISV